MKKKTLIIILSGSIILLLLIFLVLKARFTMISLFNSGAVVQEHFIEEIPYTEKMGLMLVPVEINGEKFNFIFDTGAINVISPEIAEKFDLKSINQIPINGSQGTTRNMEITKIPLLKLGEIGFKNTAAVIIDLNEQLYCFNIDGIIGSNLMQNVIWKIDKKNQIISFTDHIENFNMENYNQYIGFSCNLQYTPMMNIKIGDGHRLKAKFDTGYNGEIKLNGSLSDFFSKNVVTDVVKVKGNSSRGIFDKKIDTITIKKLAEIPSIMLDELSFENKIISFSKSQSSLIGHEFFNSRSYILDWDQKKIFLSKETIRDKSDNLSGFGFSRNLHGNHILITALYQRSKASNQLELGDQIIKMNGVDWSKIYQNEWCSIQENTLPDSIKFKIKRDNDTLAISLTRETFIE